MQTSTPGQILPIPDLCNSLAMSGDNAHAVLPSLSPEVRSKIIAMTQGLFPGPIQIERDFDPQFPEDQWFVVDAEARGEVREMIDRELLWHDKVREIVGLADALRFRLCVFPK